MYRILFAPDGKHWVDDKANNRKDPVAAVQEARIFEAVTSGQARTKVINAKTRFVIYDSSKQKLKKLS